MLFIDEGTDRTEEVYRALHAERLLHARDTLNAGTYEGQYATGDSLLVDAALLMREQ